jgi:hypothetical protein
MPIQSKLDRMAELQSKVALSVHELKEFQVIRQQFREYLADLARQKAQERAIRANNGKGESAPGT